jgi:mannan endo-1,6-alpha-mannosidase
MLPLTNRTGGTSASNPNAGSSSTTTTKTGTVTKPIKTGDRAGAGILTFLVIVGVIGCAFWINSE